MTKSLIEINEANFDSEVLQSTKPVLVDFWAEWCGPCKMLAPIIEEIAAGQNDRVKVVKVSVDQNPLLAQRYNIQSIPSLLYFAGGQLRDRTIGAMSKQAILSRLEKLGLPALTR